MEHRLRDLGDVYRYMTKEIYSSPWRRWFDETPFPCAPILQAAIDLQVRQRRWPDSGPAELMRLAIESEGGHDEHVIALCRLLFESRTQDSLRMAALGLPEFIGDTRVQDWPLAPIHIHNGVPFYIVSGWSVGGFPEPASWYLTYCLQEGVWVDSEYRMPDRSAFRIAANDFVESGPWKCQLDEHQRSFIIRQTDAI